MFKKSMITLILAAYIPINKLRGFTPQHCNKLGLLLLEKDGDSLPDALAEHVTSITPSDSE